MDYITTQKVIETYFSERFSMHKASQTIYFDGEPFNIIKFRAIVLKERDVLLDNDKYIYEIAYLCAIQRTFLPIEDYLNQCRAKYPRLTYSRAQRVLDAISTHILHITDPLEKAYVTRTLVGAVKRVYEPGCQHDSILVLRSDQQGLFKTSFFIELAGADLFTSLVLGNYDKDERMACHSKWIIELGECEGTIKPGVSKLKNFITQRWDTYRKPYDTETRTFPRYFILVGTTNQAQFLQDETDNRRFWVVEIDRKIDINLLKKHRDLVWASAVVAYQNKHPNYLNDLEQAANNKANAEKFRDEDVWTEIVRKWLSNQIEPFTLSDVLIKAIGKQPQDLKKFDQTRIKAILRSLGLKHPEQTTRVGGKPGKYYKPTGTSLDSGSPTSR